MINFPKLPSGIIPKWDGEKFKLNDTSERILFYSKNTDGWNDELTSFHEDETDDGNNPIDIYSRNNTINTLTKLIDIDCPNILEIGCSSGYLLKDIRQAMPSSNIVGADIVTEPLIKLGKKMPNIPLIQMDILNCPFKEESFDGIIALNVLEHIKNDSLAIQNMKKMLKPNGYLIIEVPAGPNLFDIYDSYLLHYRRYNKNQLISLFEEAQLNIIVHRNIGCLVYPAFFISKKLNRMKYGINGEKIENKEIIVKRKLDSTNNNKLFKLIMNIELKYFHIKTFPGIRLFAAVKK